VQPNPRALSVLTDRVDDFHADPPAEPQFAHRDATPLRELISMPVIDELLADNGLTYPLFALARNAARLPARSYTCAGGSSRRDMTRDLPDLRSIRDQLARGATLIVEQLHRNYRPVASFCRRLSYELGRPVMASAFLTPENSQGFGLQYDIEGVFVLQIEGCKTWRLYPPILPFPLRSQHWRPSMLSAEDRRALEQRGPHASYELVPGDVLWIPRGWLHDVFTTGQSSLHLSLGVPAVSKHEVITRLLESLAESEEFRDGLPFDAFATTDRARQESAAILKSFAAWVSGADPADLADRALAGLRDSWYPARCSPVTAVLCSDAQITDSAGLAAIREAVVSLHPAPDGRLCLKTGEGEVILDQPAAGFVGGLLMADDPSPVPADRYLAEIGPDAFDIMRTLLGEGILELIPRHSPRHSPVN
jgi:bifunctional lysine-specific demethylase and histidyl-hydroxylase NO66